jgi:4-hydroxyphenylpyruvate dioxygenase
MVSPNEQSQTCYVGVDYVELYVGNAWQAAHFYCSALGFTPIAYAGLETGSKDRVSFVVAEGSARLVLTSSLIPSSDVNEHVSLHGDGVRDIALAVNDAVSAFSEAVKRGARPVAEPRVVDDLDGEVVKATIAAQGDTVHSFIQRKNYSGRFLPGYQPLNTAVFGPSAGLVAIDHIAMAAEPGGLDECVDFYQRVLGFRQSHQEGVSTEYSAMNSKVVEAPQTDIKFPILEPAAGKRKSQIEEYLAFYNGPGTQHIAFLSDSICRSVRVLRQCGISTLRTPRTYYDGLNHRVGSLDEDMDELEELGILADRDEDGYLLQVFTEPVQSRPTMFLEVIQRKGALGFGGGNIKALFEAVEREQASRETW